MKKHIWFLVATILLLISFEVDAQDGGNTKSVFQKIQIRKTFESETSEDEDPAILSFTYPQEKDSRNSFLINAGIGFEIDDRFTLFAVYNRNNQIEKEQKNFKAGLTADFLTKSGDRFYHFFSTTGEYLRNSVDTTQSGLLTAYWNPLWKPDKFIMLGGYGNPEKRFAYYLAPQVGLEYQQTLDATAEAKKGYDTRLFHGISLNFLIRFDTYQNDNKGKANDAEAKRRNQRPARQKIAGVYRKGVEFKVSYEGRSTFLTDFIDFDKYSNLYKAQVIVYPAPTEDFSIGFSYNNGTNPVAGLEQQEYFLISLQFKK